MSDVKIQAPIKVEVKVICIDDEGNMGEATFELPAMNYADKESIDAAIKEVSESDVIVKNNMRIATQKETWDYTIRERTGSDIQLAMPRTKCVNYWDRQPMKLTIHEIKQRIDLVEYIGQYVDLRRQGKEYAGLCPFHADSKPSFHVYRKKGKQRYQCFVCGAAGDLVDFVSEYNTADYRTAIKIIMGDSPETRTAPVKKIIEQPDPYADFEPLPLGNNLISVGDRLTVWNPKTKRPWIMNPVMVHRYKTGYVARVMFGDDKITPTVRWCRRKSDNLTGWVAYPFADENRDLYGNLKPFGQVIIVEGEKCADAGEEIFAGTDTSVISWAGGTNAINKTNWSVLNGRNVIGIPDADQPGNDAMFELSMIIDRMRFIIPTGEAKGFDIADRNFTHSEIIDWMMDRFGELSPSKQKLERMVANGY